MSGKRAFDFICAFIGMVLLSPVLLAVSVAILLTDGSPVFFRQERIGMRGQPFQVAKFRTMRSNTMAQDATTEVRKGHPLVTPLGEFLRRFKVDEFPQLINVLRGEMSFIGPRPTVREQVEQYSAFQRRRLAVLPGLTGWAQINGGVDLTWPERIVMDVWYVEHRSLLLATRIVARTFATVLFGERVSKRSLQQAIDYAHANAPLDDIAFQPHGDAAHAS